MKQYLLLTLVCFSSGSLSAQQIPIIGQFIHTPNIYNPSLIGYSEFTEVQFVHKQQWLEVNNAPQVSFLNIQSPFTRRVNLGGNIYHDINGLITNSAVTGSFAYLLTTGKFSRIRFGLSAGVFAQRYDQNSSNNPSDPAISNFDNQTDVFGSFGMSYQIKNAYVGISFPNLLGSTRLPASTNSQEASREYLEQFIFSTGYRFSLSNSLELEQSIFYRYIQNSDALAEGAILFHLLDSFWSGGAYRLNSGFSLMVGWQSQNLTIGYSNELATRVVDGFGGGSHEFLFKYRIGNRFTYYSEFQGTKEYQLHRKRLRKSGIKRNRKKKT